MNVQARRRLARPTVAMLPRVADSLSFLYLDIVRVLQDDTGVLAVVESPIHGTETVYLPTAALNAVLLGPGVSITTRALTTLVRHGTTVLITGSGGVRCYAGFTPASLTTTWLERQARAWADEASRLRVAIRMYEQRFGVATVPPQTTFAGLRGMEGQRVKALYRLLAKQYKISRFRRSYDPDDWDNQDPVNLALSAANTSLYGIVHAALTAMGCSPGLGFIHSGNQHAFVYDIADLYKAELTIPLAFSLHDADKPEQQARRSFRDGLRLFKLLPRVVTDVQRLLDPDTSIEDPDPGEQLVDLWDPVLGAVPGTINHSVSDEF
ncbi:CRISPR-associated protein Cas1 [Actinoalloteichus hoggarensis]|uniref:CRISPR-associated endonuclease Cas1 n=1 Tax=Actinoalloteichus hoggarensis TaxID=1470176 RepID=A0A221W6X3_9PSEU|nr:type I-E CRISPR-associated endonuclease Cas1e [Actinoalloteichus hoggarensis]ASO21625.1 CRISPR-associated endonuclease Cas1 [Actinoalloteichus hoggarensis]MBB5922218.1 CRISPR-associated protein Cas1 [Actinoalloteichus hoggarensis]